MMRNIIVALCRHCVIQACPPFAGINCLVQALPYAGTFMKFFMQALTVKTSAKKEGRLHCTAGGLNFEICRLCLAQQLNVLYASTDIQNTHALNIWVWLCETSKSCKDPDRKKEAHNILRFPSIHVIKIVQVTHALSLQMNVLYTKNIARGLSPNAGLTFCT